MSSVTVLQPSSSSTTTTPASATTTLGPFAGNNIPARKPAPINPLAQTCHKCGADLSHSHIAQDAQRRISELEAQVKILTTKATAAVDKLADYEDELRHLKSSTTPTVPELPMPIPPNPDGRSASPRPSTAAPSSSNRTLPSRLPSFLSSSSMKRSQSQPPATSPPATTPSDATHPPLPFPSTSPSPSSQSTTSQLQALLSHEQTLRIAAEKRVTQTNSELEELSAQLFTEANEMVAQERKARAKLEQRVEVLEKREKEKASRLEVLERRVGRVERVRGILAAGIPGAGMGMATGGGSSMGMGGVVLPNSTAAGAAAAVAGGVGAGIGGPSIVAAAGS